MRTFIKSKDKNLKPNGYADIETCDQSRIFSLEDFEGEDAVLISLGLPVTNCRRETSVSQVTDKRGLLRLTDAIRDFQMTTWREVNPKFEPLTYNCHRDNLDIRFTPALGDSGYKRDIAQDFAERWRKDHGRYCFTTDIDRLAEMIDTKAGHIQFPTLNYTHPIEPRTSHARIMPSKAPRFAVGAILTATASSDRIKAVLQGAFIRVE